MGFGWQKIDKTLDLGYIRVTGLNHGCKPVVLFDPPKFLVLHRTDPILASIFYYDIIRQPNDVIINKRFKFKKLVGRLRPWKLESLGNRRY